MDGIFSITLRRSAIEAKMSENIVKLLVDNKFIRSEEIEQLTGLSKRGVEYRLTKLKALGLISCIGSKKTGFWEVRK